LSGRDFSRPDQKTTPGRFGGQALQSDISDILAGYICSANGGRQTVTDSETVAMQITDSL